MVRHHPREAGRAGRAFGSRLGVKLGLSGEPYPGSLPYAAAINAAATSRNFWPCVLGAVAWQETIGIEVSGWMREVYGPGITAENCVSGDGGHGLCQLTQSFPDDWINPQTNAAYALDAFLLPALQYWNVHVKLEGEDLLRALAAEFNAGRINAIKGHTNGDVGLFTTHTNGESYSDLVLAHYQKLSVGLEP